MNSELKTPTQYFARVRFRNIVVEEIEKLIPISGLESFTIPAVAKACAEHANEHLEMDIKKNPFQLQLTSTKLIAEVMGFMPVDENDNVLSEDYFKIRND